MRFVDTNVFIYHITAHKKFGEAAKKILQRIEDGEQAITSIVVLQEVTWVLEAMGEQSKIKETLEKIFSYKTLDVKGIDEKNLIQGCYYMNSYHVDFNDGVNISVMRGHDVGEVYSNDRKHLGKVEFLDLVFE